MKELNAFRKFLAEGSSKLMSQGKYWVKNNDLGPKTTTADIKKWVDGNFEKYGKPGDDKAKTIADLTAYNDGLNKGNVSEEESSFPPIYVQDEDWLETLDRERLDYEFKEEGEKGIAIQVFTPEDYNKLKDILGSAGVDKIKNLSEGTWSVGSEKEMLKALAQLDKISQMGGVKGSVELDKLDSMLYRIFGDDEFHNAIDRAKDEATDDDRFANALGDARWIGIRLLKKVQGMEESLEENSRMEFEITPEYLFDAAIQYIQDDYDGASLHVAPDGTTDDFYDGDKHVHTIKSKEQAEDIINNFEAQMVKTAQNDWADEQDAMYGKANFVEENDKVLNELNEQLTPDELRKEFYKGMQIMDSALAKAKGTIPQEQWDELYAVVTKVEDVAEMLSEEKESLTKQIMKKYPKKYKDEQAVKDAAKELMKNPKFKAKKGIGPVLQALLKGK